MIRILATLASLCLIAGCATRMSTSDPFLTVVWGDAYTLECDEGQAVVSEGEIVCPNGKSVEVRGGHISEVFAAVLDSTMKLIGALLPGGPPAT